MKEAVSHGGDRKGITLIVVVAMTFMATLDSSIVNVALPVMSGKNGRSAFFRRVGGCKLCHDNMLHDFIFW